MENFDFAISSGAYKCVRELQDAGYETYIVGGAIRDLLMGKEPKDFDISTSATPEEVRAVFGRKRARIIGKRFRLAHVFLEGELFEVSTFRKGPSLLAGEMHDEKSEKKPENLILSDNLFGTSREDAFRRDFTVNALFYDPVKCNLIDHTHQGLDDIKKGIVRAIGDPALRFEEDPVRMLRALKLVAQYDFTLAAETEKALFLSLPLFTHCAGSRLTLELEKILKSVYTEKHFQTFEEYGLLEYFLPELAAAWGSDACGCAMKLLAERNKRVESGIYRDSISLALALTALPFVEEALGNAPGTLWERPNGEVKYAIIDTVETIFAPQSLMVRVRESAIRILQMQWNLENFSGKNLNDLLRQKSYPHAREIMLIRHLLNNEDISGLEKTFPAVTVKKEKVEFYGKKHPKKSDPAASPAPHRRRHRRSGRSGRKPELPPDMEE